MNRRRRVWVILLLLLFIPIGVFIWIRILTPSLKLEGTLVVSRLENGVGRSYWLVPGTGGLVPIEGESYLDRPDLSPDRNQLVYSGWPGLYIYDLTDRSVRQITDGERDGHARWSPDGRYIVFVSSRDYFSALFRYDVATGDRHQLTDYQNDLEPRWSPDGRRIVFTTSRDGFQELYTMKPDGTGLQRLTRNTGLNDLMPDYSPDGQHIAYMTNYAVGDSSGEIWVMDADGTDHRQLTDNQRYDQNPIWSPDGRYIAFTGVTEQTGSDIFVYDLFADRIRQITELPTTDGNPVWSPDGEWIAFVAHASRGQQSQVHVVRPDGSSLRPVGDAHSQYMLSLWIPPTD